MIFATRRSLPELSVSLSLLPGDLEFIDQPSDGTLKSRSIAFILNRSYRPIYIPSYHIEKMIRTRVQSSLVSAVRGAEVSRGRFIKYTMTVTELAGNETEHLTDHPLFVVSTRAMAGPSTSTLARSFTTRPLGRSSRAPRAAMLTAQLPSMRTYASEAGGKFNRKKPHFK